MNPVSQEKESRRKALALAKEKLNKRRKQREELKRWKEGGGSKANDYGKGLIAKAEEFTKEIKQETEKSQQVDESAVTTNVSAVDVPGPRVELSIASDINSVEFNKRELVEYGKEVQTDSFDIAQCANIINDENISEKEINKIMASFHDANVKPWPPQDSVDELVDGNGADISDNKLDEDNKGAEDLTLEEEVFVMPEDKANELEKQISHSFGIKAYLMENLISTNEEHSIFYEVDAIDKENETEAQAERLTIRKKLSLNRMKGRSITNLHVSPTNPNLLLASHSSLGLLNGYFLDSGKQQNEQSSMSMFDEFDGTEGIINVWNVESGQATQAGGNDGSGDTVTTQSSLAGGIGAGSSEEPKYELICQSMVTTARFHPADPTLVIAATVSGQVLGWNMKSKKTPVMRTQFSSGHNAPVFSMGFLQKKSDDNNEAKENKDDEEDGSGSQQVSSSLSKQARHIITVSNDGRVCVWRDDFLVEPLSEFVLKLGSGDDSGGAGSSSVTGLRGGAMSSGSSEDLSTTCFSSLSKDGNVIVFGSDDGCLYKCNEMMSDSMMTGARSVIDSMGTHSGGHGGHGAGKQGYDLVVSGNNNYIKDESSKGSTKKFAHFGPITNIDFHPYFAQYSGNDDVPNLYLTSSFDWTVKLWHNKHKRPICTFGQMADYVYDVKWSPARPSVFVCGDGLGKLTMFDLLNDFDSPIAVISINEENSKKHVSITRIEWQKDGKCLFVGDSNGDISVYDVSPSLYETSDDDFERFEAIVKKKM